MVVAVLLVTKALAVTVTNLSFTLIHKPLHFFEAVFCFITTLHKIYLQKNYEQSYRRV